MVLLVLMVCNSGILFSMGVFEGGDEEILNSVFWIVEIDVIIDGSFMFDWILLFGIVKVGVKEDQLGFGYFDFVIGDCIGFDVDIVCWMVVFFGVDLEKIEFQVIVFVNCEQVIVNGDIDYYVGMYLIIDKCKEQIFFVGLYFVIGQGFFVVVDSDIVSVDDFDLLIVVCLVIGFMLIQNIKENYFEVKMKEYDMYFKCVEDFKNGQVDVVMIDEVIFIGYVVQDFDNFKVVGELFSEECYGIGVVKGDDVLVEYFNMQLIDGGDIWQQIFDNNFVVLGVKVIQFEVDFVG